MLIAILIVAPIGFGVGFMAGARVWGYTYSLHDLDDAEIVKLRDFYGGLLVQRRKVREGALGR